MACTVDLLSLTSLSSSSSAARLSRSASSSACRLALSSRMVSTSSRPSPRTTTTGSPSMPTRNVTFLPRDFFGCMIVFSSSSNCSSRIFQRRTCSSRILQKRICFCSSSSSARSSGSMYISLRICWSILGISLLRFRNCNSWPPQVSLSTENGGVQYVQCERKRHREVDVRGDLRKY